MTHLTHQPMTLTPRNPSRRGSVLILVVAVLVLLALIGTAYIATSRSDRSASAASESTAALDTLARGVVESLASRIAAERLTTDPFSGPVLRNLATGYFAYNSPTSVFRTDGLQVLAARAPYAPAASNSSTSPTPAARPRWPFLAAPISATPTDPGFFANPAPNAPISAGSFGVTNLINRARWGLTELERRASPTNHNIAAIAAVTLANDGQIYPAFFTITDGQTGYVLAADADGDGIADSGLVPLGGLPNPDYAGITFYYGLRVLDHNSALNVNTAWTNGDDFRAAGTSAFPVRNNRLFPAAIGLKESLTPRSIGSTTKLDDFDNNTSGFDLSAYRAGRINTPNSLQNRAIPVADVDPATSRPNNVRRFDFAFTTQHELLDTQLARRLDFPGVHASPPTGNQNFARFTPFTLAEQAQWAEGFVLASRDPVDPYALALSKRTALEQLLPNSTYRLADSPNGTKFDTSGPVSTPGPVIRSKPYVPSEIGFRRLTPTTSDWFNDNFNYDATGTDPTATDPISVLNLRPLIVASNPVSHAVRFKPLPPEAVVPTDPGFDVMHPYVRIWRSPPPPDNGIGYAPGDVVFAASNAGDGRYYINAWRAPINADVDPRVPTNQALPTGATAARPWRPHIGPVVPTKVDLNTAPFGDLWRAFYLTIASDTINPNDRLNTVSPFGPSIPQNLATIYRGMRFNNLLAAPHTLSAAAPADQHPHRMFRSNLKDTVGNTFLPPDQMVLLRAAQAAVNAEYLRAFNGESPSAVGTIQDIIPRRTIRLNATINGAATPVAATVYAAPRSVYITEVYINTETRPDPLFSPPDPDNPGQFLANPGGYIAVELFNPYPFPINLANWRLQVIDRTAANSVVNGRIVTDLFVFGSDVVVPPNGTIVLENYGGSPAAGSFVSDYPVDAANYRPPGSGRDPTGPIAGFFYVPALEKAFMPVGPNLARGELILARPFTAELRPLTAPSQPGQLINTTPPASALDVVPVDAIDLSRVQMGPGDPLDLNSPSFAYHYARRSDGWHFVYPGRYNADTAALESDIRQQGLRRYVRGALDDAPDVGIWADPPVSLGTALTGETASTYIGDGANIRGTFPIQIANVGFGGPNAVISATPNSTNPPNRFPFGGFLRNLDVLQVPFISPVRIHAPGNPNVQYDVISLTHDAAFAEDTATDDNAEENIGRFTPIILPAAVGAPSRTRAIATIDEKSADWQLLRYGWAADILDYLTVRPVTRQNLPGTALRTRQGTLGASEPYTVAAYPEADALRPQPVSPKPSTFDAPSPATAYDVGEQGLININTAPLPVLAAVPWVRNAALPPDGERAINVNIARSIIAHREKHGPFESIFDLNAVRIIDPTNGAETASSFRTGAGILEFNPPDTPNIPGSTPVFDQNFVVNLTNDNGDFSPLGDHGSTGLARPVPDPAFPGRVENRNTDNTTYVASNPSFLRNPPGDYESQFLMLTAVSNLLTTRSDTFTAYIVIEGWRDAGTQRATRVLQRRYAFFVDRTGVSVSLPQQLINSAAPEDSAVIRPDLNPPPRIDTNVRLTPIPTR